MQNNDRNDQGVTVFGADWCEDTSRTRAFLNQLGVPYKYVNIENDPQARQWVLDENDGREEKPTVSIGDEVLSVPSDEELAEALREHGLLPQTAR